MNGKTETNIPKNSRYRWTGPGPILEPESMLEATRKILGRTLMYIYDIADLEARREKEQTKGPYREGLNERRPHQAFLLDGARGSGKTTLLLTIQKYLEFVGNSDKWPGKPNDPYAEVRTFLENESNRIDGELKAKLPSYRYRTPLEVPDTMRAAACVLPVLYPSDLEFSQTIMEGIIALLLDKLNQKLADLKDKTDTPSVQQRNAGEKLKKKLNNDVAAGWFLSNNVGMDAVLRDSADYKDFLEQRGKTNATSFARVIEWRSFVVEFLDYFGCQLLAVFFDDTDLGTAVTKDILHTIRIFLDHPRIVTVIAGNLRSMRQSILLDEMKNLRGAMRSLSKDTEATATEWRRFARQQLEESLEKVLPRQFRMSIAQTSREELDEDYKRMLGWPLDEYCGKMLDLHRDKFLTAKHAAHFRWLQNQQEIVHASRGAEKDGQKDDQDDGTLEPYSSWWLFRNFYRDELKPRSARHIAALGAFSKVNEDSPAAADKLESEHRKRLSVILFESPENYEIVHRLNDHDTRILDWLRLNKIESCWRGNRTISINGQPIQERTYSYHALCFRVDLELAKPLHENRDTTFHPKLLPQPAGHNLSACHPFFLRNRRQHLFGVVREMKHSVIPGNCLYINDLMSLPDVVWAATEPGHDPWSHKLLYEWPKQFFFYVDELREGGRKLVSKHDQKSELVPEAWIKDYFVNTVIPMASVSLGRFMPPTDVLDRSELNDIAVIGQKTLLWAEMQKTDKEKRFFSGHIKQIETLIRRFDYLEEVAKGPGGGQTISKVADELLHWWDKAILNIVFDEGRPGEDPPTEEQKLLARQIPSYQWLLNDTRRAWHAARIFLNQTSETFKKFSSRSDSKTDPKKAPEATAKDHFSRSDLYTIGTRAALDRWLHSSETLKTFLEPMRDFDPGRKNVNWTGADIAQRLGVVKRFYFADMLAGWKEGDFYEVDETWLPKQVLKDIAAVIKKRKPAFGDGSWPGVCALTKADLDDLALSQIDLYDEEKNVFDAWPFKTLKLDPGVHLDEEYLKRPEKDDTKDQAAKRRAGERSILRVRTNFRLARAFLLFLFGLGPTLPSLIHIEIAALLKNGPSPKKMAEAALDDWANRIWSFLYFVQEFRRVLEFAKIRLDIMQLRHEAEKTGETDEPEKAKRNPGRSGVHMTMVPDLTYDQLGVRGLIPKPHDAEDLPGPHKIAFPDCKPLQDAFEAAKTGVKSRENRSSWQPMFDDVVSNLVEAANFIEVTRKIVKDTPLT